MYIISTQFLDHIAKVDREVEKDFMLALLRTQVDEFSKRVVKIEA